MDWFRSWHGAPTDNKWISIGKRAGVAPVIVSAVVWALFDYASQNEDRGSVEGFDTETYADFAGVEQEKVGAVLKALEDKGLIQNNRLSAWDRRQPKREDNSAGRVQKHREKKQDETQRNADVTQGNAPEKIQTREEKKEPSNEGSPKPPKEKFVLPDWVPVEAWQGYIDGRKSKLKDHGKHLLIGALDKLRQQGHSPTDVLNQSTMRGWTGVFAIKPDYTPQGQAPPKKSHMHGIMEAAARGVQNAERGRE